MSDDEIKSKTPEEHLADARSAVPRGAEVVRRRWAVGLRGWYLISVGSMFMVMAMPLLGVTNPQRDINEKFGLPLDIAHALGVDSHDRGLILWGTLWALSGVAAVIAGLWPGQHDSWGFYTLWTFSAAWGTLNVYGGVVLDHDQSAYSGTVYLLIAASILFVSGMTEAPSVYQSRRHRGRRSR